MKQTGTPATSWRRLLGLTLLLVASVPGCAWFQQPPAPPVTYATGSRDTTLTGTPADTGAVAVAAPDSGAVADSVLAAADSAGVPVAVMEDPEDEWNLRGGGPLRMTDGDDGQVLDVEFPIITHRDMTLTADHGLYLVDAGLARLNGNVVFLEQGTSAAADNATYDRGAGFLTATGNVDLTNDSLTVGSDRLTYDRNTEVAHLTGGVTGYQGRRRIDSQEATWSRNAETILLAGNARVRDPDDQSWVAGERILYDLASDRARVTGKPHLVVQPSAGDMMRIEGERLWLLADGSLQAGGDVVVRRGFVTGYADSAVFRREAHEARLFGNPRVEENNGTLRGDTLIFRFDEEEKLDRVEVDGNAFVRYAPQDTLKKGEVSTVEGDFLTMFFKGDEAERVEVTGNARSHYTPAPNDQSEAGTNVADGDTIVVYLEDSRVVSVSVTGNAKGTYSFGGSTAPDSAAAADSTVASAVDTTASPDESPVVSADSTLAPPDSLGDWAFRPDSVATLPSKGAIRTGRETVTYQAESVSFSLDERIVYLEGNASLEYGPLSLTAGRVEFHADDKYLEATENPVLVDRTGGTEKNIRGKRMDYNLDREEGVIDAGITDSDGRYISADRLRQVGENDFIARQGEVTTCSLAGDGEDPHFHFGSSRMRVYLEDKVVAKPVTMYIRDIPVFAFPFFVQSIGTGRRSGLLTPNIGTGVGSSRFIENLGYYWAVNDYMDLTGRMSYFQSGNEFRGGLNWRYAWRKHQMRGNVDFQQVLNASVDSKDFTASHEMKWRDWKITGRGEFRDASFRRNQPITNIGQTVDRILDNDLSLSRSLGFGGSVRLSMSRREDLDAPTDDGIDEQVLREQLPAYNVSVNARPLGRNANEYGDSGFLPFLSSTRISFSSSGGTVRTVNEDTVVDSVATDSLGMAVLDTTLLLIDERDTSLRHRVSLTDQRKLFGALNIGPSLDATEHWVDREFTPEGEIKGFRRAVTWGASVGAGTQMFGTVPGVGPVQALRHTLEPRASFNYSPEFGSLTYMDTLGVLRNRYPGVSASERQFLSLNANNRFQAKLRTADGVKRVDLFNWNLRTTYNLLADADPWSNIFSTVNLRRIYGVSVNLNSEHNPYRNFRARTFQMTGAFALGGTLPGSDAGSASGGSEQGREDRNEVNRRGGDIYEEQGQGSRPAQSSTLAWSGSFSFSYNGSRVGDAPLETRSTLNSNLSLQLTRNWSISYSNQWRISDGDITGESFSLRRDLHCWEAMFQGNRVGDNTTFYIRINIKDLPDFKVEQGRQGAEVGGLSRFLP